jgi:hypothetical protein
MNILEGAMLYILASEVVGQNLIAVDLKIIFQQSIKLKIRFTHYKLCELTLCLSSASICLWMSPYNILKDELLKMETLIFITGF